MSIIHTRAQERMAAEAEEAEIVAATQRQAKEEEEVSQRLPREVLNLHRRLDHQQSTLDTLQGTMSDLRDMVAQISMAMKPTNPTTASQNQFVTPPPPSSTLSPIPEVTTPNSVTPQQPPQTEANSSQNSQPASMLYGMGAVAISSASSLCSPVGASIMPPATACVAPQVLVEMPTPDSKHGTHVITPGYDNCCYGYPNQIQSSCVQGGSSNLCGKYLDGLPHNYGFDNLKRQSVFLADGTEHGYYALPDTYPLERATPQPVFDVYDEETKGCSDKFVDVFAGTLEQQLTYEEGQRENSQAPKCISKPTFNPEKPIVGAVFSSTNEQSICDLEKPNDGENLLFGNQDITRSLYWSSKDLNCRTCDEEAQGDEEKIWDQSNCQTATRHSILFFLWDPGASESLHSSKGSAINMLQHLHNKDVSSMLEFSLEKGRQVQWDPGILKTIMKIPSVVNWSSLEGLPHAVIFSPNILMSIIVYATTSIPNIMVSLPLPMLWDPGASKHFISSKIQHPYQALQLATSATTLACSSSFSECTCLLFWIQNSMYVCQKSENGMAAYIPWDPGVPSIIDMILDKYTMVHQVQFLQRTVELSSLSLTDCMQYFAFIGINPVLHSTILIMQRAAHVSQAIKCSSAFGLGWSEVNAAAVLALLVPCPKATAAQVAEQRRHLEFSLLDEMPLNVSEFTDGQLAYMPQGSSINSSEWVRNMVNVLSVWSPSFKMAKLQWDPGAMLLQYKSKWLLLFTEEKEKVKLVPEKWIFWCNAMHYRLTFQRCTATSSLFHCHGIPLWLINFQVP